MRTAYDLLRAIGGLSRTELVHPVQPDDAAGYLPLGEARFGWRIILGCLQKPNCQIEVLARHHPGPSVRRRRVAPAPNRCGLIGSRRPAVVEYDSRVLVADLDSLLIEPLSLARFPLGVDLRGQQKLIAPAEVLEVTGDDTGKTGDSVGARVAEKMVHGFLSFAPEEGVHIVLEMCS